VLRYWDSSGAVALIAEEPGTELVGGFLQQDAGTATWGLTAVEVAAAIERRAREGLRSPGDRRRALGLVERLGGRGTRPRTCWGCGATRSPCSPATRCGRPTPVSSAPPGWRPTVDPKSLPFVTLGWRLAAAAERKGWTVLTWPEEQAAARIGCPADERQLDIRDILVSVAKVLLSIDDELLARIDRAARRAGLSRSAYLARLAARELGTARGAGADPRARRAAAALDTLFRERGALEEATAAVRADRDSR
jgi:hypothetical protein